MKSGVRARGKLLRGKGQEEWWLVERRNEICTMSPLVLEQGEAIVEELEERTTLNEENEGKERIERKDTSLESGKGEKLGDRLRWVGGEKINGRAANELRNCELGGH